MLPIDLRSDTVTKPTQQMLEAMFSAQVGDDVFGDDPTVNALEEKAARLFGMEAALFCASGTMTNQIAIRVHTHPGSEVICDKLSHIYLYEGGGVALNSLSSVKLLEGNKGRINAAQVRDAINNPDDIHAAVSRLVSLENTMNKGGGCFYQLSDIEEIKQVCQEKGLALHLDGARLFNALVETQESPMEYGQRFDSISICLSKGLGCPVGSLLLGSRIYALDHHVQRLKEDHARARAIGQALAEKSEVEEIYPIDTNIVIFRLPDTILATDYVAKLAEQQIFAVTFGKHLVRFVTHLDFTDTHLSMLTERLKVL